MALIDELLVGLGFEYDSGEAKKFSDDIGKTVGIVKELAKAAIATATAITGMVVASSLASDEQGKLADEIGETVNNVNALQFAQQIAGGSADGMSNSLRELSLRASEAARGVGSGVEAFGLLGISTTGANGQIKSANNLLKEVSGRMQGLGRARQIELADKLGLRDSIRLLQLGPQAIGELTAKAKALGETTAEDAKVSAEFNDALIEMWSVTKQISRLFTRVLAPIMNDMVDTFTDWWIVNRDIIEQNLPKWIEQFTTALKLLSVAMGAFIAMRVLTHLYQMIALMRGLALATLAANVGFFLLPLVLSALALAFVLLVDEAKVFFEGGETFIGDMIEKYPEWAGEIRTVASVLQGVYDLTMLILGGWDKIFGLFREGGADAMNQALKDKGLGFLTKEIGITDEQSGPVNDLLKSIGLGFLTREIGIFDAGTFDTPDTPPTSRNENIPEETNSKPFNWMDFLKSDIGIIGEKSDIVNDFLKNKGIFGEPKSNLSGGQANSNGMMSLPNSSNTNNVTTVENIEISINGAGQNPEDIAQSVYDVFFQQTSQDLNSTVDQ